jgi:1-aminocyclopropane-1-carboxylate deaminase
MRCRTVPRWLRHNPSGNFARALALGADIVEVHADDYRRVFSGPSGPRISASPGLFDGERLWPSEALWIPQGGAEPGAEDGVKLLGDEILSDWKSRQGQDSATKRHLVVIVPAGTGTTALFLAQCFASQKDISVVAAPCIGDASYLKRQMADLEAQCGRKGGSRPLVLEPQRKESFGVPRAELLSIWRELRDAGLFVDLLYAPRAWEIVFEAIDAGTLVPSPATTLMYIHTGGCEGVSSQLTRYKHSRLLDDLMQ